MYYLRELQKDDLPKINTWRNDQELITMLEAPFRYINLRVDEMWFDAYMLNRANTVRCAIVRKGDDAILGLISLVNIDYMNQKAELHIMIGDKENQGKGIGTYAINTIIQHAFNNLNLHRIELSVLEENLRAQHVYEKAGFVCEGCKRKAVYKNGKYVNIRMYAILKE